MVDTYTPVDRMLGGERIKLVDLGDGTYAVATTATISGDVTIGAAVEVTNDAGNPLTVSGAVVVVATEFTRPANTTAYTAGDVVSNSTSATTLIDLASLARANGGSGYIVGLRLSTDKKSITPRIRVHLFNASNPTVAADNAAHRESYADSAKRIGYWDLPAMTTGTDTTNSDMSRSLDLTCRIPFVAGGSTRSLYAMLEALDAFTPASGQKFTLTVAAEIY